MAHIVCLCLPIFFIIHIFASLQLRCEGYLDGSFIVFRNTFDGLVFINELGTVTMINGLTDGVQG